MDELQPVVKAIDPTAIGFKNKRKEDRLKMFLAKDFIDDMVSNGFADKQAQFDQIPQSREQLDLEEETAEPLKIERRKLFYLSIFRGIIILILYKRNN